MRILRTLYIKWLCLTGQAIDIWSKHKYPSNVLSNLYNNEFDMDGIHCQSMEGFLQSLKVKDSDVQIHICSLLGKEAKNNSTVEWKENQTLFWKGQNYKRESSDFRALILRAYSYMFTQNETFRNALLSTKGEKLYHTKGNQNPQDTILTEEEFCDALTVLRDKKLMKG